MSFDLINLALSKKIAFEESTSAIDLSKYSIDIESMIRNGNHYVTISGRDNSQALKNEILTKLPRLALVHYMGMKIYCPFSTITSNGTFSLSAMLYGSASSIIDVSVQINTHEDEIGVLMILSEKSN